MVMAVCHRIICTFLFIVECTCIMSCIYCDGVGVRVQGAAAVFSGCESRESHGVLLR